MKKILIGMVTIGMLWGINGALKGTSFAESLKDKPKITYQPTEKVLLSTSEPTQNKEIHIVVTFEEDKDIVNKINSKLGGELKNRGEYIVYLCRQQNISPYLFTAIARHETANGTSKAIKEQYNPGGLMNPKTDKLKTYGCLENGLEDMADVLGKYYIKMGLKTIKAIQQKYCPVGVANDPTGLNKYWLEAVTNYYKEMKGVSK